MTLRDAVVVWLRDSEYNFRFCTCMNSGLCPLIHIWTTNQTKGTWIEVKDQYVNLPTCRWTATSKARVYGHDPEMFDKLNITIKNLLKC